MTGSSKFAGAIFITISLCGISCGRREAAPSAKITQFRALPPLIPSGITGKLCYGVENAKRVELNPRVEDILPASDRCLDIMPKANTTYTLTAYGLDGGVEKQSVEVKVGPPAPQLSDVSASATQIRRGATVKVCFKAENAKTVKVSAGKLNRETNCLTDRPRKTTTYKITAVGSNSEADTGSVTVRVR